MMKTVAFWALAQPIVIKRKLEQSARENRLTVLSFHRVAPPDGSAYPPLAPRLFEEALNFCKRNFELVQFRSLAAYRDSKKPLAIISFDDGYLDFVRYSLPILRRGEILCNHNLIPACLLSGLPPANVLVQDFIGKAPQEELRVIDALGLTPKPCPDDRVAAGLQVSRALKRKPIAEQRALLARLHAEVDLQAYATPMMSIEDARSIRHEVELGAHSFEHASLSAETDAYIEEDAAKCRRFFEQEIDAPTDIYALPNGEGASRAGPILRNAGYRHILLTEERYSDPSSLVHPRFTMAGSTRSEIRFRAAGFTRQ